MNELRYLAPIAATFLLLGGCATMSADQCASADWYSYGYEDGAAGRSLAMSNKRAEACHEHGYAMDRTEYVRGRDDGLWVHCAPERGYELGRRGGSYSGACVAHDERAYLAEYERGRELHGYTSAVSHAEAELAAASAELASLTEELFKYASGHRDEGVSTAEHNEQMLELWSKRNWLKNEAVPYWQAEARYARRELEGYQQALAAGRDPGPRTSVVPGPDPYPGPSTADVRAMLAEVFSGAWSPQTR